ncbi:MAG TPA: hypothetical protein VMK12_31280, partial [Anaeromyxobacteraceae bacterium]|nr:hypothetical protein [Anaeromyxobacteraceae bacterium]
MARAYSDIARVLDEARRRQGWIIIGASLCRGCAVGLGVLLLGVFLLGAGIGPAAAIRQCSFGLAALASLAALALAGQTLVRRIGTRAAMARSVGWAVPELASDLISSVELHEEYPELERSGRYSLALVDAHIARTAERALGLRLARVVPAVSLRRAALFLSAAVAANLLALVAAPSSVLAGWRRLVGSAAPAPEKPPEPITGDIEITYFYPAYMKREPKTLSGTGGEVSAPKGTEVALATRADRRTESAEIAIEWSGVPAPGGATRESAESGGKGKAVRRKICPVQVTNGRELSARFVVEGGGAYRFRFRRGSRLVAEGPPLPIAVEPDAFPEIRVTAPAPEIEVGARARVRVEWTASDDVGLGELTLLTKAPSAEERRTPLRSFGGIRHESGGHEIDLAPLRLAEGERLLYWLEVSDNDAISGPKRSASATQVIKVYSEAEHHRAALKRAQVIWEELVRLLGDRLPFFDGKPGWTAERLEKAQVLDGRLRALHEGMRAGALELRQARAAPRPLSSALENIAARLKAHEQELSSIRGALVRFMRFEQPDETTLAAHVAELDAELDRELERDVLYLEQLFDKQRADDLVQAARDLAARRRDLADLLEKYRRAPTEQRKRELVAEVDRLKARMQEMMRRMGELAKGMSDEHMNEEALAEMARSNDAVTGLEQVEEMLSRGDLEGATKALDQLGNTMQQMLSALEKTAGQPGERNEGLLKEMRSFKRELEEVEGRQKEVARETEDVNGEYRRKVAEKMKQ